MAWYIAYGEGRGGEWNYQKMQWIKFPQPLAVLAIPAEVKKT